MTNPPAKDALPNGAPGGVKLPPHTSCSAKYYLDGGDLWIIIDTTYIRVHSSFFAKGSSFFTSFLDQGQKLDSTALPGTGRPENAIIVRIATIKEFERFCWIFYNEKLDDYSEATLEEWFTILRLAHAWGFDTIKAMALRYIKSKEHEMPNVVDRIIMYEKYSPPAETLLPLYVDLCKREEYPTDEECVKLGDGKALKIHRTREKLFRAGRKATAAGGKLTHADFTAIVAEGLGLKEGIPSTTHTNGKHSSSTDTSSSKSGSPEFKTSSSISFGAPKTAWTKP